MTVEPETLAAATELKARGIDIAILFRDSQASATLMLATYLDELLTARFEMAMHHLSRKMIKKLTSGFGPLSTMAAKIDVGYGLGFITREMWDDATLVKAIRNKFAHSIENVHFGSKEIVELGVKLSTFNGDKEKVYAAYFEAINKINRHLVSESNRILAEVKSARENPQ